MTFSSVKTLCLFLLQIANVIGTSIAVGMIAACDTFFAQVRSHKHLTLFNAGGGRGGVSPWHNCAKFINGRLSLVFLESRFTLSFNVYTFILRKYYIKVCQKAIKVRAAGRWFSLCTRVSVTLYVNE